MDALHITLIVFCASLLVLYYASLKNFADIAESLLSIYAILQEKTKDIIKTKK